MSKEELLFCPLGGSGEIGMNMNLYAYGKEDNQKWIIVDLGVTFADDSIPGIDLIMPDPGFIIDKKDDLLGIVLTHAHEDHIGAISHIWPKLKCNVYATPFTAALVTEKFKEKKIDIHPFLKIVNLRGNIKLGPFDIELITMTHSILEPNGLKIKTPLGCVLHTGDWKCDPNPLIGDVIDSKKLKSISKEINIDKKLIELISNTLIDEAPVNILKGNAIKKEVNEELDSFRNILQNNKKNLQDILQREIENTGISSLKISFNNVFGYYLEVTNAHKNKVPEEWIRKQTLVNAERYITEELKEYEVKILNAEENIKNIELLEFEKLLKKLIPYCNFIQQVAKTIGYLDCLQSFAEVSVTNNYSKPDVNESFIFEAVESRHPVIEHSLEGSKSYIPNDITLNKENQQILMITGPNMSGKSAVLRQTALLSIMAQVGCYVPAKSLNMGIFDKIFTRVGASDNISQGESTFMIEMLESSLIINNMSERSLILLDEIGRGTSTYDGISIAWAISQYIHDDQKKPLTLFATHYHELNMMTDKFKRIRNFNIQVKETSNDVIFLRKLIPGGSAHSFGIHVAKMAGMPQEIIKISKNVLKGLEKSHGNKNEFQVNDSSELQLTFFDMENKNYEEFKDELESIDTNNITPMQALVKLSELKNKIRDEK